jgi:hypothetical protein
MSPLKEMATLRITEQSNFISAEQILVLFTLGEEFDEGVYQLFEGLLEVVV